MKFGKVLKCGLVALSSITLLSACGSSSNQQSSVDRSQELTLDVYDDLANYMGVQEGWFAKQVKDKFNIKLNIIAPNVAGNGDALYQTRTAAGNLGDIVITNSGQRYQELVEAGLLYDATDLYKDMKNVNQYDTAVQHLNKDGKIYGFPTEVSSLKPTEPSEALDLTFGSYLRWDLYQKAGYPKVNTLEDLLPVLETMQKENPTTQSGKKVYAFSLFADWDGNMMNAGKQLAALYGYDELGFTLVKADGSDVQSVLDSKSEYIRALKFYFKANQMGLVDPESTTQNWDTLFSKYQDGQVLFSWWPWLGKSAYNTSDHLNAGMGFMEVPIADQKIFSKGNNAYGGENFIGIGSNVKDPKRVAEFIDWLYSPEGIRSNSSSNQGSAGIKGLTWDLNKDNKPELTDFGKKAFLSNEGVDVPSEYGKGSYKDGVSALNVNTVSPLNIDPETQSPYFFNLWESYQAENDVNPVSTDWKDHMDQATSTIDYLEKHNQILVAPGSGYIAPKDDSEIDTIRNQIKSTIKEYSWKMVFAKDEAEFNNLLKEMQDTANGLGYDKVLSVDKKNAEDQIKAREAVLKDFK
ncbi:ABC transporter substrate-binding protein [Streptococcus suis]|uniref:ABC transporter substrate-binding protein n=1 Tax=Streptococcus suis TaxID=1307 RepID=UPI0019238F34|nr:ABC transporter substrate-binding protein [Streptococcus suis]MBL1125065.1 ABC transporter substrate-binding protein [Streptococcus suis]